MGRVTKCSAVYTFFQLLTRFKDNPFPCMHSVEYPRNAVSYALSSSQGKNRCAACWNPLLRLQSAARYTTSGSNLEKSPMWRPQRPSRIRLELISFLSLCRASSDDVVIGQMLAYESMNIGKTSERRGEVVCCRKRARADHAWGRGVPAFLQTASLALGSSSGRSWPFHSFNIRTGKVKKVQSQRIQIFALASSTTTIATSTTAEITTAITPTKSTSHRSA